MVRLTLTAIELAIVAAHLHYIAVDSHYLQIKFRSDWQSGPQHFLPQLSVLLQRADQHLTDALPLHRIHQGNLSS
jgi:hypothetical protein